mgnify:CR=1 FL=1
MKHLRTFNESEKFLEIDLSILKDIYCDLADKHNIYIKYDNTYNRIDIIKYEKLDHTEMEILHKDINNIIDRSIKYYYEETNIKIFAYILNYDYVNFFNINYKTNSLTIRYEFYSVPNISYARTIIGYVNANYKKLLFLPEN